MTNRAGRRRQHRKHKARRVRVRLKEAIEHTLRMQRRVLMGPPIRGMETPPDCVPMTADEVLGWLGQ